MFEYKMVLTVPVEVNVAGVNKDFALDAARRRIRSEVAKLSNVEIETRYSIMLLSSERAYKQIGERA